MIAEQLARQPVDNAEVLLAAHRPLSVDRVLLLIDIGGVQQRIGKKARETIQCLGKGVVLDHHHVIGDIQARVGVGHAAVLCGKRHEAVGLGELRRAHEQHVLQIVRHTRVFLGI